LGRALNKIHRYSIADVGRVSESNDYGNKRLTNLNASFVGHVLGQFHREFWMARRGAS
jgi:hypothetical protein